MSNPAFEVPHPPSAGRILIEAGSVSATANLNDSATAKALIDILPIEARANRWGEEIYFSIPLSHEPENAREVLQAGELAFWPPGNAFCIFFGPTPASVGDEIRAASAVSPVGRVIGDATRFKNVRDGAKVRISKQQTEEKSI